MRSDEIHDDQRGEKMIAVAQNDMRIVVIPAKSREEIRQTSKLLKVAAYCRVSTDEEEQKNSYQAQIEYYTEKINKNPEWQMAGIFADVDPTQRNVNQSFQRICSKYRQAVHTRRLSLRVRGLLFGLSACLGAPA